MHWLMIISVRVLLRLYPTRFRAAFGDEMQAIITQVLVDARQQGGAAMLLIILREWLGLFLGAIHEQRGKLFRPRMADPSPFETTVARWAAWGVVLLSTALWGYLGVAFEDLHWETRVGSVLMVMLTLLGLALGQRRKRTGSILVFVAGLVLLAGMLLPLEGEFTIERLLMLMAIALPHFLAGALLFDCARASTVAQHL